MPGLDKAGLVDLRQRHENARPVGQPVAKPVGHRLDGAADRNFLCPEHQAVADFEAEALEQHGIDERALSERLLQIFALVEHDRAHERIGLVHDL